MSHPIQSLIERFENQIDIYKRDDYNEAQTRSDFINPFFIALGWDVNNEKGVAEHYRPVLHEEVLKIDKAPYKRPDYSFRLSGVRRFFVEAKKPSINLKTDKEAAYQLRRYGWNAKLSLSLLTNFAELAVYDCRIKPEKDDAPSIGRILYLKYTDYIEHWAELVEHFSFDAVWQGQFDHYAQEQAITKGAIEVDTAFLNEISRWREKLAQHILSKNARLTARQLNIVVQQTIDRIVFLRICEDRGIEDYGRLLSLTNGHQIYKRLFELFLTADQRYNSGLFHFKPEKGREQPDRLTPQLKIGDDVLREIILNLYYPHSPYEFSVLPADILGQVYERFLGKVIRIADTNQVMIEDKSEVKKAGGVYYTPSYIVDYIVKQTVGQLLDEKRIKAKRGSKTNDVHGFLKKLLDKGKHSASQLKILDPACGSGSFLLGAYHKLLDWHLEQYLRAPEIWIKGKNPRLYQASGSTWKLTVSERKRILLNNIYGIDIDPQAVEVTKLSLLLKVLEDEQSVISQLSLFKERVLPDLNHNIKCGNALIGQDFYQEQQLDLIDEETQYRVNAFDWENEFAQIMQTGGFDIVIGNPPYVRQELLSESKPYFKAHYQTYYGTADLYVYFIEKAHHLLRENGRFGMILSNKFMRANYGKKLRHFLLETTHLEQIIDFGELPVFEKTGTFPVILLTYKTTQSTQHFSFSAIKSLNFKALEQEIERIQTWLDETSLQGENWTLARREELAIFQKVQLLGQPLGEYVEGKIYSGIKTGLNQAFVIDQSTRDRLIVQDAKSAELIKSFATGDDIRQYFMRDKKRFLIFIPKGWTTQHLSQKQKAWTAFHAHYPAIAQHLAVYQEQAEKRWDQGDYWWELRACDYYDLFKKPKIVFPDIALESRATFDESGIFIGNTAYIIPVEDKYLLGLLNSSLIWFYYKHIASVLGDANNKGRLRWIYQDVVKIPIRKLDFDNPTDNLHFDKMVQLVNQMLKLNKQLDVNNDSQTQTILERRLKAIDKQIDFLVYTLYDLTPEQIDIVEKRIYNDKDCA